MATRTVATLGTGAITAGSEVAFRVMSKDFEQGARPIVSVNGLAGAETATLYLFAGGSWIPVSTADAAPVIFTATYPAITFNSPGTYGLIKDASAAELTISVTNGQ